MAIKIQGDTIITDSKTITGLSEPLAINLGGTGATTISQAVENLGIFGSGLFTIGTAGEIGFGLGMYNDILPSGFSALPGTSFPSSHEYGNYQYSDGSICCWIPKCYMRIGHVDNPTYSKYLENSVHIVGTETFANENAARNAGYAMFRAFYDGGSEKAGFFIDKYANSINPADVNESGSFKNGKPISLTTSTNFTRSNGMTGCTGILADSVVLSRRRGSGWHCASIFQYTVLAFLSLAHGQAATSSTHCAWFDPNPTQVTNFPKGCNNNSLRDWDDSTVLYVSADDPGASAKPLTGSANFPAKVSHNGQLSGVMDLNGTMWETALGITNPGSSATASGTISSQNAYVLKRSVALHDLTNGWNGATDAWGETVHIETLYDLQTNLFRWTTENSWHYFGNGTNQVFSENFDPADIDYIRTMSGIALAAGYSGSGTNLFGRDGNYRFNRENLFPIVGGNWFRGSLAGVFTRGWNNWRSSDSANPGFRAGAAF